MPNFGDKLSKEELADIKSFVLYSADALGKGVPFPELMASLAKMQYLADTKGPDRKAIE